MKQIYSLGLVLALFVSGCSSTHNVSHDYVPTPNPTIAGYWVGSNSIHTYTMLVRADGTGELCWEGFGKYQTTRVTISGKKIIAMSEADFTINPDKTISQCAWGTCVNFKRVEPHQIAAACKQWLKD